MQLISQLGAARNNAAGHLDGQRCVLRTLLHSEGCDKPFFACGNASRYGGVGACSSPGQPQCRHATARVFLPMPIPGRWCENRERGRVRRVITPFESFIFISHHHMWVVGLLVGTFNLHQSPPRPLTMSNCNYDPI